MLKSVQTSYEYWELKEFKMQGKYHDASFDCERKYTTSILKMILSIREYH